MKFFFLKILIEGACSLGLGVSTQLQLLEIIWLKYIWLLQSPIVAKTTAVAKIMTTTI